MSARDRIKKLFLDNVGKILTKDQIFEVAEISEWARRVRELRDEFGYAIESHKEHPELLKPGEYILNDPTPTIEAKQRKIKKDQYFRILNRDHHHCLSCGRKPGDVHPTERTKTIKLVVDHVYPISDSKKYGIDPYSDSNLQALCDFCNEGKWNKFAGTIGESKLNLAAMVRHAPISEQREIYLILKKIFEQQS